MVTGPNQTFYFTATTTDCVSEFAYRALKMSVLHMVKLMKNYKNGNQKIKNYKYDKPIDPSSLKSIHVRILQV